MPLLFAYGILQQDEVQRSIFGRLLRGPSDELVGFERHHAGVTFTCRGESRVGGTLFEVTDAELAAADRSDALAGFGRVSTTPGRGWEHRSRSPSYAS